MFLHSWLRRDASRCSRLCIRRRGRHSIRRRGFKGFGRQEPRSFEHPWRWDGKTTLLKDVFGDRRGIDRRMRLRWPLLCIAICMTFDTFMLPPLALELPPRLQRPSFRLYLPFLHKMTDDVQPFSIPGQHPRPDLKLLIRLDLPPKAAVCAPKHNANRCTEFFPEFGQAPAADPCHEMRACNVEVAEIGAVWFVNVPIALIPSGPGPYDERLEKGSGRGGRRPPCEVDLAGEGVKDAYVPCAGKVLEVQQCVKNDKEFPYAWSTGKTEEGTQFYQAWSVSHWGSTTLLRCKQREGRSAKHSSRPRAGSRPWRIIWRTLQLRMIQRPSRRMSQAGCRGIFVYEVLAALRFYERVGRTATGYSGSWRVLRSSWQTVCVLFFHHQQPVASHSFTDRKSSKIISN